MFTTFSITSIPMQTLQLWRIDETAIALASFVLIKASMPISMAAPTFELYR